MRNMNGRIHSFPANASTYITERAATREETEAGTGTEMCRLFTLLELLLIPLPERSLVILPNLYALT
ncbi:MAG: hypothetical protein K0R28_1410 [Paenibacillus sp.]|nr:hypothetical protein [Paenibacillus sp.]